MQSINTSLDEINQQMKKLQEIKNFLERLQIHPTPQEETPPSFGEIKIYRYWQQQHS